MKEYQQFASKYREELLSESKQMTIKYHEDLLEAHSMESTVTSLYSMMNEFINVLQSQEDHVVDIHETSKKTTTHVQETDKELLLTIERSKSYQMTIVSMIIGLALFLLVLDGVTP
jgi:esterase/lipase